MRNLIITILLFGSFGVFGQRLLLEMPYDPTQTNTGPNRSHFGHMVISLGYNSLDQAAELEGRNFWNSANFNIGGRYIRKLGTRWAWSNDFLFNFFSFEFDADHLDPDDFGLAFDKINRYGRAVASFEYAPGIRFSIQKRRGNIVGRYLEVQGLGGVILQRNEYYRGENAQGKNANYTEVFSESSPFYYGGVLRLGLNKVSLYARYIANDIIRLDRGLILYGLELDLY